MFEAALSAMFLLFEPTRLLFLSLGVIMGLSIGVIPGLGGVLGLTFLLPFTFYMDPITAIAFLMGLSSVSATSDTIPAVLFGIPGTVASAATTLDGYPMAQKGQAGRALGAAFSASIIGGIFGALILGLSVPVLKPLMLYIGSPELLAICILGLSMVAILSGSSPLKGLIAVCLGVLIATVGFDSVGQLRFTMDLLYLYEGFPLVPVVLGLFAIPEIADLVIQRSTIQQTNTLDKSSQWDGIKDTFKHWFLVLRCSTIGTVLGAIPGLGAAIIDWISYGHAAQTEKNTETFGKGDVRGVIASESANNAKEGGSLVPTIAFGVPGSASMAIILGALFIQGIVPGPEMLTTHLDLTYAMAWSIAIANILGAGICFMFAGKLAKLATIEIGILAPLILSVIFIGAFQGSGDWGDIYTLLIFGALGFLMKRLGWPRPPLVLGFVLGSLIERYFYISISAHGWGWLFTPSVAIILFITMCGILKPIISHLIHRKPMVKPSFQKGSINLDFIFMISLLILFVCMVLISAPWPIRSSLFPTTVGIGGIIFSVLMMANHIFIPKTTSTKTHMDLVTNFDNLSSKTIYKRGLEYFAWCISYVIAAHLIGMLPAIYIFITAYMLYYSTKKKTTTIIICTIAWISMVLLFHIGLQIQWPDALIHLL